MGASYYRYAAANQAAFRELLLRWLGTLPTAPWKGTFADLEAALVDADTGPAPTLIPSSSGLSKTIAAHEATIEAAGWRLGFTRTSSARFVTLKPIRRRPAPTPEA